MGQSAARDSNPYRCNGNLGASAQGPANGFGSTGPVTPADLPWYIDAGAWTHEMGGRAIDWVVDGVSSVFTHITSGDMFSASGNVSFALGAIDGVRTIGAGLGDLLWMGFRYSPVGLAFSNMAGAFGFHGDDDWWTSPFTTMNNGQKAMLNRLTGFTDSSLYNANSFAAGQFAGEVAFEVISSVVPIGHARHLRHLKHAGKVDDVARVASRGFVGQARDWVPAAGQRSITRSVWKAQKQAERLLRRVGGDDVGRYVDRVVVGSGHSGFGVLDDGTRIIKISMDTLDSPFVNRLLAASHELTHAKKFTHSLKYRFKGDFKAAHRHLRAGLDRTSSRYAFNEIIAEKMAIRNVEQLLGRSLSFRESRYPYSTIAGWERNLRPDADWFG